MRFSVQVSRHYGGSHGVGGQIGMHSYSQHETMAQAKASAGKFARKFPKDEVLIYDNQAKRVTTVRSMPKQNPSAIRAQVRRLPSGQIQLKVALKRGENAMKKAQQIAKALGRKVVSVGRAAGTINRKTKTRRKRTR